MPKILHLSLSPGFIKPLHFSLIYENNDALPLICLEHPLSNIYFCFAYKIKNQPFFADQVANLSAYSGWTILVSVVPFRTHICLTCSHSSIGKVFLMISYPYVCKDMQVSSVLPCNNRSKRIYVYVLSNF